MPMSQKKTLKPKTRYLMQQLTSVRSWRRDRDDAIVFAAAAVAAAVVVAAVVVVVTAVVDVKAPAR